MKTAAIIVRTLLGLGFIVFGLNMFHPFLPSPPMSGPPADFFNVLGMESHYLTVVAFFEVLGGLLALSGRFTPLGLTIIGAIGVNILTFHIALHAPGLPMATVFALLELFCLYAYRSSFAGIFGAPVAQA